MILIHLGTIRRVRFAMVRPAWKLMVRPLGEEPVGEIAGASNADACNVTAESQGQEIELQRCADRTSPTPTGTALSAGASFDARIAICGAGDPRTPGILVEPRTPRRQCLAQAGRFRSASRECYDPAPCVAFLWCCCRRTCARTPPGPSSIGSGVVESTARCCSIRQLQPSPQLLDAADSTASCSEVIVLSCLIFCAMI